MTAKRFTTTGYYIYDHFKEDRWLVNEVEAEEIVTVMNNLDTKARERSKALSKLQKENEQLNEKNQKLNEELCILQIDLCKTKSYEQLEKENKRLKKGKEQLKERNNRQAKRLAELYELMAKKDWESLTEIIDDFCSCEEQLQREWRTYE